MFSSTLNAVSHDAIGANLDAAGATPPSNAKILAAAKQAYGEYQPAVDGLARAVVSFAADPDHAKALSALADYDWDGGFDPSIIAPIANDPRIAAALADFPGVFVTSVVGVNRKGATHLSIITHGMTAPRTEPASAVGLVDAKSSGLAILSAVDGQLSISVASIPPLQAEARGYGLAVTTSGEVPLTLGILLDGSLDPVGFQCSVNTVETAVAFKWNQTTTKGSVN